MLSHPDKRICLTCGWDSMRDHSNPASEYHTSYYCDNKKCKAYGFLTVRYKLVVGKQLTNAEAREAWAEMVKRRRTDAN